MADEEVKEKTEPDLSCYSWVNLILYKMDRTLSVGGLILIACLAIFFGRDEFADGKLVSSLGKEAWAVIGAIASIFGVYLGTKISGK